MGTVTSSRPLEEWAGQRVYRAIESVTQRGVAAQWASWCVAEVRSRLQSLLVKARNATRRLNNLPDLQAQYPCGPPSPKIS